MSPSSVLTMKNRIDLDREQKIFKAIRLVWDILHLREDAACDQKHTEGRTGVRLNLDGILKEKESHDTEKVRSERERHFR
jgi:hypothetical protein